MLDRLVPPILAWLAPRPRPSPGPPSGPARVVVVLEAPGGRGASTAIAIARAGVGRSTATGRVVLADLTLDAPHRALHGIDPDAAGLVDLAAACRFGPPTPASRDAALHPVAGGYAVVPGLRRHHDWLSIGGRSAATALAALRDGAQLVVAHADRDLEGESETGSFDIEDRNVLARTAVRSADLVVVAADDDRAGRQALLAALAALAAFGVPHERTLVVTAGIPWPASRHQRLGDAVHGALARASPAEAQPDPDSEARRIAPGTLGRDAT